MSSPSLLAVVNQFPAETFIERKLVELQRAGLDVTVAAGAFGPRATGLGLGLVPTAPWRRLRAARSTLGSAATAASLSTALATVARSGTTALPLRSRAMLAPLAAVGADIVHFEFSGIAVAYRDVLEQLRPARLVVSCRGTGERLLPLTDPDRAAALRSVFDRVDLIHCVSASMADTVIGLGADRRKILVNRPAVSVAALAPPVEAPTPHPGPVRIASVGRLHWMKGLDDGVRAVAALVRAGHDVEHRIAGTGPERDKLAYLVEELGLRGSVHLLGSQDPGEVQALLRWADLLLLPSLSEGISNAALEAMAAGVPVLSTDCGGMGEVIDDGVDGLLVPAGDHDALRAGLEALVADGSLRRRLGAAARRRAEAEFDLSRQVEAFLDAYRGLVRA